MRNWLRSHPNFIIGFIARVLAVVSIILLPTLLPKKTPCKECDDFSRYILSLTPEQKANYDMFEAAVIQLDGRYYFIGEGSADEFELYRSKRIIYKEVLPVIDEQTRRLATMNSLLKLMPASERELILKRSAVIIYRDGHFILVSNKDDSNI